MHLLCFHPFLGLLRHICLLGIAFWFGGLKRPVYILSTFDEIIVRWVGEFLMRAPCLIPNSQAAPALILAHTPCRF